MQIYENWKALGISLYLHFAYRANKFLVIYNLLREKVSMKRYIKTAIILTTLVVLTAAFAGAVAA